MMHTWGYTPEEIRILRKLSTPSKVQDYLNVLPINPEKDGDTYMSPRRTMRTGIAHCFEGALLAAAAFEFHGRKPWIMDLRSLKRPYDDDHVIAVFRDHGCYGAISKSNHAVLRYREPIYRTLRELALSYFHEYFLDSGAKTLREYSRLIDLSRARIPADWRITEENLWDIAELLDAARHYPILSSAQAKRLRRADPIEIKAGKIVEYPI